MSAGWASGTAGAAVRRPPPVDPEAGGSIAANTPAWGFGIAASPAEAAAGVPIVNAGPWGRDYHTPLERLHIGYAFEVLPELVLAIVRGVLRDP